MTTIACDGEMIAGDGLITGNGMAHEFDFEKVWRLSSGVVVGYTGSAYQKAPLNDFLEGTSDKLDLDDSFEAILLHPCGLCECMDHKGVRYRQQTPCVTGSGGAIALGAMLAGKTALDAVHIACLRDTGTGGTISFYQRGEQP